MKAFLQRFGAVVLGIVSGFDRLVFNGQLRQLYTPDGMNRYCNANRVPYKEFKAHAKGVTQQVLQASLIDYAKKRGCFEYLRSGSTDKDEVARGYADKHRVKEGLVCVLQCVEPCWTFDVKSQNGRLTVQGEWGKCSNLYQIGRASCRERV